MNGKLFAHSWLDGLLVLTALGQWALLLYGVLTFGSVPWGASLAAGLASAFLTCINLLCVAPNFIHTPFSTNRRLDTAFSLFNSLLIGAPQSLYRVHHLHRPRYNNDAYDPATGTTRDLTATWRHGRPPCTEEGLRTYALVGYFRSNFFHLLREAGRRGLLRAVKREFLAVQVMVAAFAVLNPLGLVAFYLPVWLLGNVAAKAAAGRRPG
jgi:fatty acid desaturase